jgi:chemotaxis protein MotB
LIVENQDLKDSLEISEAESQQLSGKLGTANIQIEDLVGDTTQLSGLYKELIQQYQELNNISKSDAQNLSKQIQKVGDMSLELQRKDNQLKRDRVEIDSLNKNLNEREKRVSELEKIISDREKEIQALNSTISNALMSFKDKGLTVEVKNGKVYVTLDESLLFQSGSYNLDVKGKTALQKLSKVLSEQENVSIVVEGHTDDVHYNSNGGPIKDNWDLSVLRATNVVRELQKSGVDVTVLSASGRGPYSPKVSGDSAEARAKNRRTEIIISPNLDELYEMIEKNK